MTSLEEEKNNFLDNTSDDIDQNDFAKMVDESLNGIKEGEVVDGRVVEVTPAAIIVDIGYKAEGEIPIDDFEGSNSNLDFKPGDKIRVLIEAYYNDGEDDVLLLSHRGADEAKSWETIENAHKKEQTISGTITGRVKGGFRVDIGIPAFLPGSQVDLRPIRDAEALVGKTMDFRIIKYSRQRRNIVLSRRVILEKEREIEKLELMTTISEGQILTGVVKNVVRYGAFLDLGGMDGLLHVSDMSWGRINHPSDLVSVGQKLDVIILKFDQGKQRISLGLKQLHPDPWKDAIEKYPINSIVTGKVVNIVDYGVFIEIEPGLEGLIHVSEFSWDNNSRIPEGKAEEGLELEAVVISIDTEKRKLALSVKRTSPDPWSEIADKYPVDTIFEGQIKSIADFGIFISMDEGIDGLIHRRDISWLTSEPEIENSFKVGETIKTMVVNIDHDKKRISLGIKQLTEDPWPDFTDKITVGDISDGTVVKTGDNDIAVLLSSGIEGLINFEEEEPIDGLNKGDDIRVKIIDFQPDQHLLSLSLITD